MGRLIDADRLIDTMAKELYSDKTFVEIMKEQPTVKAIPLDKVEQILEEYKLRIPPTVYYELLADVRNYEVEQ